jgi:hypothetical protein
VTPTGDAIPTLLTFAPDRTPGVLRVGRGWGLEIPPGIARDAGSVQTLIDALLGHLGASTGMSREEWNATANRVRRLLPHAVRMHTHAEGTGSESRIIPTLEGVQVVFTHPGLGLFRFTLHPPKPPRRTPRVGYALSAHSPGEAHRAAVEDMLMILKGASLKSAARQD